MTTKWDVLTERAAKLRKEADELNAYLASLDQTPFTANGTGKCSACGTHLETEGDFARHFEVPDLRYLNLGDCPVKPRN